VGTEQELGGYALVGRLAVGGMAEVYQARVKEGTPKGPGEPDEVVIKRLLPAYRSDNSYVKQFVDEAKLTVRLNHPHIVRTYRCFKAGLDYLMVQELVSGRTLSYLKEILAKSGAPMPPAAATYIVFCLLKALDYVHRGRINENGTGIIHRDVNPSNILLSVAGDVKLTDFGVAEPEGTMKGEEGALRGTIAYMSPEQVLGQPVDVRSDLYSAGIVLWELWTNRNLFTGDTDLEVMQRVRDASAPLVTMYQPELPHFAAQVARRALFADRTRRFQTAVEFQRALQALAHRMGWPLSVEALQPLLGG
jgi:serine/threonine-protein kinase